MNTLNHCILIQRSTPLFNIDARLLSIGWLPSIIEYNGLISEANTTPPIGNFGAGFIFLSSLSTKDIDFLTPIVKSHDSIPWVFINCDNKPQIHDYESFASTQCQLNVPLSELKQDHSRLSQILSKITNQPITAPSDPHAIPENEDSHWLLTDVPKKLVIKAAHSSLPVMITGEPGTGKEVIAEAIYHHSLFRGKGLMLLDGIELTTLRCLHSSNDRVFKLKEDTHNWAKSIIQKIMGHVLFIKNIDYLPTAHQSALLFLLKQLLQQSLTQQQLPEPSTKIISSLDSPSSRDTSSNNNQLFHLLNAIDIYSKPLKSRPTDIAPIAEYFFLKNRESNSNIKGLSHRSYQVLTEYSWPGNLPELLNKISRGILMCETDYIEPEDMGMKSVHTQKKEENGTPSFSINCSLEDSKNQTEASAIVQALDNCNHNVSEACRKLKVSRAKMYRLMQKHHIHPR